MGPSELSGTSDLRVRPVLHLLLKNSHREAPRTRTSPASELAPTQKLIQNVLSGNQPTSQAIRRALNA